MASTTLVTDEARISLLSAGPDMSQDGDVPEEELLSLLNDMELQVISPSTDSDVGEITARLNSIKVPSYIPMDSL